jgi:L-lactate dehydrogenase
VLPVAAYNQRYGVSISLPSVITRHGVDGVLEPDMSDEERDAFDRSVRTLRQAGERIGVARDD